MRRIVFFALIGALTSCNDALPLPTSPDLSATLQITTEKSSYTRSEIPASSTGIRGTITNAGDRTVFARMGDAFNGAVEQNPVYVANGSDGALEHSEGSNWVTVEGATLVEGVKEIELRAGKSYSFIAHGSPSAPAGTYRITVSYRTSAGASQPAGRASSASFEIR